MPVQLKHEGLAETHHFGIRFAAGREVGATLGATHGECGQGVLEGLLKGQELQDGLCHAGVEADSAFIGADGIVVLYTVSHVGMDIALVVHPVHAELDDAVGDAETLDEIGFLEFRMFVVFVLDGA